MPKDRYAIATEQPNPHTRGLDRLSALQIARKINAEDFNAARAVKKASKPLRKLSALRHKPLWAGIK